jgi:hypothetical protein
MSGFPYESPTFFALLWCDLCWRWRKLPHPVIIPECFPQLPPKLPFCAHRPANPRATVFELVLSHTPDSSGSARTESRKSTRPAIRKTALRSSGGSGQSRDRSYSCSSSPSSSNSNPQSIFRRVAMSASTALG